jgi:hypothetical protein
MLTFTAGALSGEMSRFCKRFYSALCAVMVMAATSLLDFVNLLDLSHAPVSHPARVCSYVTV